MLSQAKECPQCGATFVQRTYFYRDLFCSPKCRKAFDHRRPRRPCACCRKQFQPTAKRWLLCITCFKSR